MGDYGYGFYIGGGGGSYGGGSYDDAYYSSRDSIGPGSSGGHSIDTSTSLTGTQFYDSLVTSPYLSPDIQAQLQDADANIKRWVNYTVRSGTSAEKAYLADYAAYKNALAAADANIKSNIDQYNQVMEMPRTAAGIGLQLPTSSSLPAEEASLLSEYGRGPSPYTGPTISDFSVPNVDALSAYNTWKNSAVNDPAVQQGYADYANAQPIAPEKPFMPNGAPKPGDILADELFKLYGLDGRYDVSDKPGLLPYNPLKSDWKGSVNIGGLMKGLFAGLLGPGKSMGSFKQFDTPQYGLLAKSNINPQDAANPITSAVLPWQRTHKIKPQEYESNYLDGYINQNIPKLEQKIAMPELNVDRFIPIEMAGLMAGKATEKKSDPITDYVAANRAKRDAEKLSNTINRLSLDWKNIA